MGSDFVLPIIESVYHIFEVELGVTAQRGPVILEAQCAGPSGITVFIGMTGPISGTLVLGFPDATARRIADHLLDCEPDLSADIVAETFAQLARTLARNARLRLCLSQDQATEMCLPIVVHGQHFFVCHQRESSWIDIPFASGHGPFSLRLALAAEKVPV
ncbi:MAG: hypothetical protein GC168_09395 [Candidatus Hydrogenedens sp.]|nr:hypothetical protein [Candidatus Hydrogenedens sp.]